MGLYLEELAEELNSKDPEVIYLTLIKIFRLPSEAIADESEYLPLHRNLRSICLRSNDMFANLAFSARDAMEKYCILRLPKKNENTHNERINILQSIHSDPEQIIQSLTHVSEYGNQSNLELCKPFLNHVNPIIRSAAIEAFHYHATTEHIIDIIHLLNDRNPRVVTFLTRLLQRFGYLEILNTLNVMIDSDHPPLKIVAIKCLARIESSPKAIDLLIKSSKTGPDKIRFLAIKALSFHVTPESIQTLKNLQNDINIEICEIASTSLKNMEHNQFSKVHING